MADEITPEMKKYLDQMADHHKDMIDYHTDMLSQMENFRKPSDESRPDLQKSVGPYERGSVSPLGGKAKPPMVFKAPKGK